MLSCDLHTHSFYSDGSCSPEELISLAKQKGLSAVALTDHHTVKGLPRFLKAAKSAKIEAVAGIEISAGYRGKEVHILGLFLPESSFTETEAWIQNQREAKRRQYRILADNLRQKGVDISFEEIQARFPESEINRAHFGMILTEKGYTASTAEALQTLLSEEAGCYQPPKKPDFGDVIKQLNRLSGIAVLAHPLLNLPEQLLPDYFREAKEKGACAAETYYSRYREKDTERMKILVKNAGLLESGGSDFHGSMKPDIDLGTGRGSLKIPYRVFETLRQAAKSANRQ